MMLYDYNTRFQRARLGHIDEIKIYCLDREISFGFFQAFKSHIHTDLYGRIITFGENGEGVDLVLKGPKPLTLAKSLTSLEEELKKKDLVWLRIGSEKTTEEPFRIKDKRKLGPNEYAALAQSYVWSEHQRKLYYEYVREYKPTKLLGFKEMRAFFMKGRIVDNQVVIE